MTATISDMNIHLQPFIFRNMNEVVDFSWKEVADEKFIFSENTINNYRLFTLEQDFTHQLISSIFEETFEYGMESMSHLMVKKQMKINSSVTKEWLNRIYVDNFQNVEILIGLLRIISRFESEEINPTGQIIALASLSRGLLKTRI
jgi:hypothetical protein